MWTEGGSPLLCLDVWEMSWQHLSCISQRSKIFLGGEPREYVESTEMIVSRDIGSPQGTDHLGMSHGLLWQEEL